MPHAAERARSTSVAAGACAHRGASMLPIRRHFNSAEPLAELYVIAGTSVASAPAPGAQNPLLACNRLWMAICSYGLGDVLLAHTSTGRLLTHAEL